MTSLQHTLLDTSIRDIISQAKRQGHELAVLGAVGELSKTLRCTCCGDVETVSWNDTLLPVLASSKCRGAQKVRDSGQIIEFPTALSA